MLRSVLLTCFLGSIGSALAFDYPQIQQQHVRPAPFWRNRITAPSSTVTSTVYETTTVSETLHLTTTVIVSMTTTEYTLLQPTNVEIAVPSDFNSTEYSGVSWDQFKKAITFYNLTSAGGVPPEPSRSLYAGYLRFVAPELGLIEQAMFLANVIWETAGFQYREEIACAGVTRATRKCPYGWYHGRGWIQLSWEENYARASEEIYGDDRLVQVPGIVTTDEGAWRTAVWYWKWAVQPRLLENDAIDSLQFGHSIRAINGAQECSILSKMALRNMRRHPKRNFQAALNRLAIFNAILADWGLIDLETDDPAIGTLHGCIQDLDQDAFQKLFIKKSCFF